MIRLDSRSMAGCLLRLPLPLIPASAVVPVLAGPARGMRWVAGSAPHGAWLGMLERAKLGHFVAGLRRGITVWDVGANVGLYTLPAARAAGTAGRVVAFEPMPRNLAYLRRHLALNGLGQVSVCEAAVLDESGTARMAAGDSPSECHITPAGPWEVRAVSLDQWRLETEAAPPDVVKIDVEGSDDAALRGGALLFAKHRPLIYLSLHGERQRRACGLLLGAWGYEISSLERGRGPELSSEWLAEPR